MKQKMIIQLVLVAILTTVVSVILSSVTFAPPKKRSSKVPVVDNLSANLGDVKNDPNYNVIFYDTALDPTKPVQIGNSQNPKLFNGQ